MTVFKEVVVRHEFEENVNLIIEKVWELNEEKEPETLKSWEIKGYFFGDVKDMNNKDLINKYYNNMSKSEF